VEGDISLNCLYKQILFVIPSTQAIIVRFLCVLEKGLNSSLASLQGGSNLSLSRLNPLETTQKKVVFNFKKYCCNHRMHIILYFKPLRSRNLEAKNQNISKSIGLGLLHPSLYRLQGFWSTFVSHLLSTFAIQVNWGTLSCSCGFQLCVRILSARDGRKVLLTLDKSLVFFLKAKNFIVPWVGLSNTKCRQEWPGLLIV
jgi:hypothetical protein